MGLILYIDVVYLPEEHEVGLEYVAEVVVPVDGSV